MTNDIKDIRNKFLKKDKADVIQNSLMKFTIGTEVRNIKSNQVLIIKDFDPVLNKYSCYNKEGLFIGRYHAEELID